MQQGKYQARELVEKYPFRILHVVDDFSTHNTGVTSTVRQMAQWQAQYCDWVGVHATGSVDLPIPTGVSLIQVLSKTWSGKWRYPACGSSGLLELIRAQGITHLHVHEFWRGGYVAGMRAAMAARIPVVLSAHGATSPWALFGQGWIKRLKKHAYWKLFARHLLPPWTALHAITPLEQRHMQQFFGREPKVVIPNAFHQTYCPTGDLGQVPCLAPRRLVFLGRLHPVKGVDLLIHAFHQAHLNGEWELLIAGPEEVPSYAKKLKDIASAGVRAESIRFIGACYGTEKSYLLASAWVVVVPSRTEVMGMVNLEASSAGTPTITTHTTGLVGWADSGGILIEDSLESLRAALEGSSNWSLSERLERGARCQRYVVRKYEMDTVGKKWLRLYSSLK